MDMGLGVLGKGDTVFKRKFRWTMEFQNICGIPGQNIEPSFVKSANRPSLSIEEVEINYLNGKMWIPGKGTPDTTTVTYYDIASKQGGDTIAKLFTWLATVYNFTDADKLTMSSAQNKQGGYTADRGVLSMYDGCGNIIDGFEYLNPWPTQIQFGELDYSSNDECNIELTIRYRNFVYFRGEQECTQSFPVYCAGCTGDAAQPISTGGDTTQRKSSEPTSLRNTQSLNTPNTFGGGNA